MSSKNRGFEEWFGSVPAYSNTGEVITEEVRETSSQAWIESKNEVTSIRMNSELMTLIESKKKSATTRLGIKNYRLGEVLFVDANDPLFTIKGYTIYRLEIIKFKEISDDLAKIEGYNSSLELKDKLGVIYGEIESEAQMTIVYWR